MQPAKNYDVHGNVKLRGKILDKTATKGGFYSGQFGEVAYKSDFPFDPAAAFSQVVKLTNQPGYSDLNVISFNANEFYLANTTNNPDEVSVHLRDPHYNEVFLNTGQFYTLETTAEEPYFAFTIPANTLKPDGSNCIRGEYIGTFINKTTSNAFTWRAKVNGVTVFTDTQTITASAIERATSSIFHLLPLDENSIAFFCHDHNFGNITAVAHGYGSLAAAPTVSYQIFGNFYIDFNYGAAQLVEFTFDTAGTIAFVTRDTIYGKWEILGN